MQFSGTPEPPTAQDHRCVGKRPLCQLQDGVDHIVLSDPPPIPGMVAHVEVGPHPWSQRWNDVLRNQHELALIALEHEAVTVVWARKADRSAA